MQETVLPGMKDFAKIDCTHTVMPFDSQTADYVIHFLQHQCFPASALSSLQSPQQEKKEAPAK